VRKRLLMLNSATWFWLSTFSLLIWNGCHHIVILMMVIMKSFENSAKLLVMSDLSEKVRKFSLLSGDSITLHCFVVATGEDFSLKSKSQFWFRWLINKQLIASTMIFVRSIPLQPSDWENEIEGKLIRGRKHGEICCCDSNKRDHCHHIFQSNSWGYIGRQDSFKISELDRNDK
jgi:hypothetical protein